MKKQKNRSKNSSQSPAEQLAAHTASLQQTVQPKGFPGLPENWVSECAAEKTADGKLDLFSVLYHAEPWKGERTLVVIHGFGEHCGRYLHLPHFLGSYVDSIYCYDHRGHGRSEGLRGHVDHFQQITDDAAHLIRRLDERLKARFGRSEIHLLGHSLGGQIALRTLLLNPDLPIASVTLSAPLIGMKLKIPFAKRVGAAVLAKIWGSLRLTTEVDSQILSHDPAVAEAHRIDPLVHHKVTPKAFEETEKALRETLQIKKGITVPLQMLIPMKDELVNPEASLKFFRDLDLQDKRLKTFPKLFHEIMNETDKEEVFNDIGLWISGHRKASR